MRRVSNLLSLLIILFSFGSCGTKPPINDLQKMNLNGDVILIKDPNGFYIFFNDEGNIIKKYFYYSPNICSITNYFYIDNRLSKTIGLKSPTQAEQADKIPYREIKENFNYDNNGNLLSTETSEWDGLENKYYFYENGKLIKDSSFYVYGSKKNYISINVTTFDYRENVVIRQVYKGNSYNSRLEYEDGKSSESHNHILFFENGLEIKSEYKDRFGSDESTLILLFEYEKDMKGNWVKQKKSQGEPSQREIFYKGDDISLYENKFQELKKEISSNRSETNNNQDPTSNNEVVPEENNIQSNNTAQQQEKRKCYSCNGTGQCPKCSKPQRVRYKQGESPNDHNETRLGMIVCTQCGGNLMNFGADKNKSCYLCKASGWLYCPECNSSGNGSYIGKCKRCKGSGFDN